MRLRQVTLYVNGSRFQIRPTLSSRIRLPALGARGRISAAGTSCMVARQEDQVTNMVIAISEPAESTIISQRHGDRKFGTQYIMEYAVQITRGKTKKPIHSPDSAPAASSEEHTYEL